MQGYIPGCAGPAVNPVGIVGPTSILPLLQVMIVAEQGKIPDCLPDSYVWFKVRIVFAMRCFGKGKPDSVASGSQEQDAMAQLRHTMVGGEYLGKVHTITDLVKGRLDFAPKRALSVCKHSPDIFHQEYFWPDLVDKAHEMPEQKISRIVLHSLSVRTESLAARATGNQVNLPCSGLLHEIFTGCFRDIFLNYGSAGMILPVAGNRMPVGINSGHRNKSGLAQSLA